MALLTKNLAFLPLTREGLKCLARSASVARAVTNKNNSTDVLAEDDDDDDNDDVDTVDMEEKATSLFAVGADEDENIQSVDCRVFSTVERRPWVALQDETSLKFRMDMPGITKDNVKVYLDNTKLVVKGKYPSQVGSDLDEDSVLADNEGSYSAEIALPDNVKKEQIKSEMKDGILLVTVPKQVTMITVE